ncbi:MAG: ferrochelatase [Stenotrophobium sp.]
MSAGESAPKTGVLLINLGTPDAPTAGAIRRYLREFLSDRRVVEAPRVLWWPVLYGLILPFRPRRLVRTYASVWTERGSPLLAFSLAQRTALQNRLGADMPVALGMTYGQPGIAAALAELDAQQVRRIIVLPLYPQYSATTTAAALDAVFQNLSQQRWLPELRTINSYHTHPLYIAALADSVRKHWAQHGPGEHLMMSFHGLPQSCVDAGDPYDRQCRETAQALAQALQLDGKQWSHAYQSRLGRLPWLQPYTDQRIAHLAQGGMKTLDVICPGFSADCLETLEEISLRYAAAFRDAGGAGLRYIPALNDSPAHMDLLQKLLEPVR